MSIKSSKRIQTVLSFFSRISYSLCEIISCTCLCRPPSIYRYLMDIVKMTLKNIQLEFHIQFTNSVFSYSTTYKISPFQLLDLATAAPGETHIVIHLLPLCIGGGCPPPVPIPNDGPQSNKRIRRRTFWYDLRNSM